MEQELTIKYIFFKPEHNLCKEYGQATEHSDNYEMLGIASST